MKFDITIPSERLKPYIKKLVVSENPVENVYKVFPSTGLVIGFQYRGQLNNIQNDKEVKLATAGITGISDSFEIFKNSIDTGSILVYFTEVGLNYFTSRPANELFNQSISLENIFDKYQVSDVEEKLTFATQFLLSQLRDIKNDELIVEAVKLIYQSKGTIKIRELNERLFISQSPFEKRFRKLVGTTAKKFASIVRFNCVLND